MCPPPTSDQPIGAEAAPRNNSDGNEVYSGEWRIDIPIEGSTALDHNRRARRRRFGRRSGKIIKMSLTLGSQAMAAVIAVALTKTSAWAVYSVELCTLVGLSFIMAALALSRKHPETSSVMAKTGAVATALAIVIAVMSHLPLSLAMAAGGFAFIIILVVRSSMGKDRVLYDKEAALLVNSCITGNLAPVLSLEQGLDAIKAAVEELKANPPTCSILLFEHLSERGFELHYGDMIILLFLLLFCFFMLMAYFHVESVFSVTRFPSFVHSSQVARREDPDEDIAAIKEVRRKVGENIVLRVDANRKWTYDAAVKFAHGVKECCLQYIEDPVDNEDDIKYNHSGVAVVVIKPGVIGGFENAALVARWAQQHGKMTVISAAFESALGLSAYIQFARYLDVQNAEMQSLMKKEQPQSSTAHGFGTYKWFKEQVTAEPLDIHHNPQHGSVEADAADAGHFLQKCRLNPEAVVRTSDEKEVKENQIAVDTEGVSFSINVLETGESNDGSAVMFLHGFLGTSGDWIPIMKAISSSTRSIAIDLPGHGGSKLQYHGENDSDRPNLSIDVMAEVLHKVLKTLTHGKIERAMIISGSPGLIDDDVRTTREAKDDFRASTLISNGLEFFLDTWYAEELWASLRSHPHFKQTVAKRLKQQDLHTLGKVLSDLSIGRQPLVSKLIYTSCVIHLTLYLRLRINLSLPCPSHNRSLWEDLKQCKVPLQLVVGEKDAKFKAIAIEMQARIVPKNSFPLVVEIPSAGHAVHVENPLAVITAITQFVKTVKTT
ncbi:hypothetical protein SASPL_110388 [Salvia splendens]|uniref:Mandelate racemase/muconate lactonizing enzyme C-terminal domain-containing protein n=1 Tax=Salvia splendens TaxID=180675 RepID=A0A8X8Y9W0_SALSN|nr:hypothetical protein SASPL_110388 [Salvia splendens]